MYILIKDNADDSGLGFVEGQLVNLVLALVHPPAFHKVIAIRGDAALKASIFHKLSQGGLGADGGLFAFPICLPKPDIVGELVGVVIKPLLPLLGAPDPDAVLDKPLHYKGRFVRDPSDAVKHEHQQNIKLALPGAFLDDLQLVPIFGSYLVAGHTVLLFLVDDIIKKMRFSFLGVEVELQSTANDSLVVIGSEKHTICPICGWTSDAKAPLKAEHYTSWGSKCIYEGQGDECYLSHVFKTDVVQITFFTIESTEYEKMLSVMYALLEGLSRALDIERTDLKGCLHRKNCNGQLLYSIILNDAVAGGAGHVRRLVTDDGKIFSQVLRSAYEVVTNCDCQPSCYHCLRNYYNQRIHDLLDRDKAKEFLAQWLGDCVVVKVSDAINDNNIIEEAEIVMI